MLRSATLLASVSLPKIGRFRRYSGNPILTVGAGGEWDETSVRDPFTLRLDTAWNAEQYWMYYRGEDVGGTTRIGLATAGAPEGAYTRFAGNPVLEGTAGTWDGAGVSKPRVLRVDLDYRYYMYYSALGPAGFPTAQIGLAFSDDGEIWLKYAGNPIISPVAGTWEGYWVGEAFPLKIGDLWYLLYVGENLDGTYPYGERKVSLGLALSDNGKIWPKYSGNPIVVPRLDTTTVGGYNVGDHSVVWLGDLALMAGVKQGTGPNRVEKITLWYSVDLIHWFEMPRTPALGRGFAGEFDAGGVGDTSLLYSPDRPGELFLIYEASTGIGLAKAPLLDHATKPTELVIDETTIGASGTAEVTTYDLDNAKAVAVTCQVTYGAATDGVRVWLLSSPDRSNFDTQNAADALTDFEPSFSAGDTRQKTILLDTEGVKYLKVVVENLDGAVATGAVKVWITEQVEPAS